MKNIGRNDLCYCGSGKKYKHCCLNQTSENINIATPPLYKIARQFSKYNSTTIAELIGALSLCPENHSQAYRLKLAGQAILISKSSPKAQSIKAKDLEQIFKQELPEWGEIGRQEDPQECLFTDLILFYGGNHIVYPEVLEDELIGLKNIMDTIFMIKNDLPEEFCNEIYLACRLLLYISNQAAIKAGHIRYMISPDRHREPIYFPSSIEIRKYIDAVSFSENQLLNIFKTTSSHVGKILQNFIIDRNSPNISVTDQDKNPLSIKPLYKDGDKIILLKQNAILSALIHFIINKIQVFNIYKAFLDKYNIVIRDKTIRALHMMGYKNDFVLPSIENGFPNFDCIFRIDDNKIAYVQLLLDDFSNYPQDYHHNEWKPKRLSAINERKKIVFDKLIPNNFANEEIFCLNITSGVGRYFKFFTELLNTEKSLSINIHELLCLSQSRKCNSLTLWKFVCAEEEINKKTEVFAFSFLDKFGFYKKNNDSFYVDDKESPTHISIEVGYGNNFRQDAHLSYDLHLARFDKNNLVPVVREHQSKNIPIYYPDDIRLYPRNLIQGYIQPIWIEPDVTISDHYEIKKIYQIFLETYAYWVWQLTPSLYDYFAVLGKKPITIQLKLMQPQEWKKIRPSTQIEMDIEKHFKFSVGDGIIIIYIPIAFYSYFFTKDNTKDQVLIRILLYSINSLLQKKNCQPINNIEELIDRHASLKTKTMIHAGDSIKNPFMIENGLPSVRFVEHHDSEQILDDLVEKAGITYPIGEIISKDDRNSVCHKIVSYCFKELQALVAQFPFDPLLIRVISLSEALWQERYLSKMRIPAWLACYGDNEQNRKEIIDKFRKRDEASLCYRCLIEIIAVTPPKGSKIVNNDDIDKMIALMDQIITWGTLSDEIQLGVHDVVIGVLPSGRIGTNKDFNRHVQIPYSIAKHTETIEDYIEDFENKLRDTTLQTSQKDAGTSISYENEDNAYKAEFGLPKDKLLGILLLASDIGIHSDKPVVYIKKQDLIKELSNISTLSYEEIAIGIEHFIHNSRKRWDKIPEEFNKTDIYPWRYNRKLSYMRRPFIAVSTGDDSFIYFGFRQVLQTMQYVDDLVQNGKFDAKSEEMKKYIGTLLEKSGKEFTNEVYDWFIKKTISENHIVLKEIKIGPGRRFAAPQDLGDIDILFIDKPSRAIFSIECKNVNPARISSEYASEIQKFETNNDNWIDKHLKRHKWLKDNMSHISHAFMLDVSDFKLISLFLTNEKIPYSFIRQRYKHLPFIDFYELKREGIKKLSSLF